MVKMGKTMLSKFSIFLSFNIYSKTNVYFFDNFGLCAKFIIVNFQKKKKVFMKQFFELQIPDLQ